MNKIPGSGSLVDYYAQLNAQSSQAQNNFNAQQFYLSTGYWTEYPRREMTAEDLRLPIDDDGLIDFTFGQYDIMFEHRWGRVFTDAPYAFWLGAEAA